MRGRLGGTRQTGWQERLRGQTRWRERVARHGAGTIQSFAPDHPPSSCVPEKSTLPTRTGSPSSGPNDLPQKPGAPKVTKVFGRDGSVMSVRRDGAPVGVGRRRQGRQWPLVQLSVTVTRVAPGEQQHEVEQEDSTTTTSSHTHSQSVNLTPCCNRNLRAHCKLWRLVDTSCSKTSHP